MPGRNKGANPSNLLMKVFYQSLPRRSPMLVHIQDSIWLKVCLHSMLLFCKSRTAIRLETIASKLEAITIVTTRVSSSRSIYELVAQGLPMIGTDDIFTGVR